MAYKTNESKKTSLFCELAIDMKNLFSPKDFVPVVGAVRSIIDEDRHIDNFADAWYTKAIVYTQAVELVGLVYLTSKLF
jgi:hypothetical protein